MARYADRRQSRPAGRDCATCGQRTAHIGSHALREHVRYDAPSNERRAAILAAKGQAPR